MLISLAVWGGQANALGLGAIALQSGLGRPLQATIPVYGLAADEAGAACLKSRLLALDGSLLARPVAELAGSGAAINIRTAESLNEPAVKLSVEIGCNSGIRREYQLLLDPVTAPLPLASSGPAEGLEPAGRKAASRNRVVTTAAPAPGAADATPAAKAAVGVRKTPPPARPRPVAETRSVLTLTGGEAEIEQVRARLALRSATTLSEPRVETDPARLAALRADQARVAALLRGEDPAAGAKAQIRDVEGKLLALQKSAANAARLHEQEKAALTAAQEDMVSARLAAVLGGLLLSSLALTGWLLGRRAADRRRQEQAFFAMAAEQDAAAAEPLRQQHETPETAAAMAEPEFAPPAAAAPETTQGPGALAFSMPAADLASLPAPALPQASYDWRAQTVSSAVASSPPETLEMPESWLALENRDDDLGEKALQPAAIAPALLPTDDARQAHAAELACMLLEAETWMDEHKPARAAELLRPYLDREEMQSPAPALYLLSLYRTMDDKGQITTVLAQLQQDFPVEAAAWSSPEQQRRSMADFPAVHAAVDSISDSDELLPYLNSLLLAPEPFDFSTYRDIVRAIGLANETKQQGQMQLMSLDSH